MVGTLALGGKSTLSAITFFSKGIGEAAAVAAAAEVSKEEEEEEEEEEVKERGGAGVLNGVEPAARRVFGVFGELASE